MGQAIDAHTYRTAFALWPTGVCVVSGLDRRGRALGLTVGSLASVSIDPPLLAFCPRNGSTTWAAIRENGRFCINLLAHDQSGLCRRFASGDPARRFEGVDRAASATALPRLAGCCAWIEAATDREIPAGDHSIVLGAITAIEAGPGRVPLVFARGRLGRVEDLAEPSDDPRGGREAAPASLDETAARSAR